MQLILFTESERLLKRSLTGGGTPPDDASQEDQGGFTDEETQQDANLDQEIRSVAISTLVKEQLVGIGAFDTSRGKKFTKVCEYLACNLTCHKTKKMPRKLFSLALCLSIRELIF